MNITVSQIRDEMVDREAIRDCLFRYSRGIDRMDADLLRTVYWPGAMDYHTGFTGTAEEFIEWALPRLGAMQELIHMLGNILIRLNGDDKADVETYFWSVNAVTGDDPHRVFACGRYLDKFEKRNDEWRIAERVVAHDWFHEDQQQGDWEVGPFGMTGLLRGTKRPDDKSYSYLKLE